MDTYLSLSRPSSTWAPLITEGGIMEQDTRARPVVLTSPEQTNQPFLIESGWIEHREDR